MDRAIDAGGTSDGACGAIGVDRIADPRMRGWDALPSRVRRGGDDHDLRVGCSGVPTRRGEGGIECAAYSNK